MTKINTIPFLKKKLWRLFSEYIRLKYSKKGICKCWTCDAVYQWKDPKGRMQAGHFISQRDCPPLIFDENNVRPQCNVCNSIGQGMQYFYGIALANEKGQDEVDRLFRDRQKYKEWKKHNPKKSHVWQRDWLNNKIAKYDAETKRLKGLH